MEMEMGVRQRGLVDTCLEEGQYESAIMLLEQLRSPTYMPSTSHVRQLVYISLHPTTADALPEQLSPLASPSKAGKALGAPAPSITPAAVVAARKLLMSFSMMNTPEALARAIPDYDSPRETPDQLSIDQDSLIAEPSMCVLRAKDCWHLLEEDFIQASADQSRSNRTGSRRPLNDDDGLPKEDKAAVGTNSWAFLHWLLFLFEKDQNANSERGKEYFSPLLLRQIPSSRDGPRWNAETPVKIAFCCFMQQDTRRRMMGPKLLEMLINLAFHGRLAMPMLTAYVLSHLLASGPQQLLTLLSHLKPSRPNHYFKLSLCQAILIDASSSPERAIPKSQNLTPLTPKKARRPAQTNRPLSDEKTATDSMTPSTHSLPPFSRIRSLIYATQLPSSFSALPLLPKIKYELLMSYGALKHENPSSQRDVEWEDVLRNGTFEIILNNAFGDEGLVYKTMLLGIVNSWTKNDE